MNVDPEWSLAAAFEVLSSRHTPGSLMAGRTRNLMLQVWGELVGRRRALAEFEELLLELGSRTAMCRQLTISPKSLRELERYFESLPPDNDRGRWNPGARLGPWLLLRRLGKGGNSEVWRARRAGSEECALKIPAAGKRRRERFAAEIEVMRSLNGMPGVMPILSTGVEPSGTRWLAMPIMVEIRRHHQRKPNLSSLLVKAQRLAATLAQLHARDISHRDIKPENLFHARGRWLLSDFGLASFPGKRALTQAGNKLGPVYYVAPEMLLRPHKAGGAEADVYSFAKTLWVILSGQRYPLPGEQNPEVAGLRISSYVNLPKGERLDRLFYDCTRHDPAARPTSKQLAAQLLSIVR